MWRGREGAGAFLDPERTKAELKALKSETSWKPTAMGFGLVSFDRRRGGGPGLVAAIRAVNPRSYLS